ncbi:threonine synthase [Shimia sp.]|uniref:threonine synthase n=1 Tax=Shimia sp. TaxID=1954381 RepID=UPI003BAD27F1
MRYLSTRGQAAALSFKEALLVGLASDGGLYVPEAWPHLSSDEIRALRGKPYPEVAFAVMSPFVGGEIEDATLRNMIEEAYATFHHPAVTPLVQMGPNDWLLELFHGPTLAFKDVAMQILARLMDHVLTERGERLTIVGATSGDTGGAALEAFKTCDGIDTFFMFPNGKVSDFQRRQMTTVGADNCHALALDGSFDDCQSMVKEMFGHQAFASRVRLSAVNSINWGRVMAQVVYYFTAATALGAPEQKVSFTVPTGNFGDIYAGYVAKQMGLPIDRLVIATNENDILARTLATGDHKLGTVKPTITPSMDIQISSNFERLLFEAAGRDSNVVRELMAALKDNRNYKLPDEMLSFIRESFDAGAVSEVETLEEVGRIRRDTGYLADPHTAVAVKVAQDHADADVPMVTLSTAHPAKFPDAVFDATQEKALPPAWGDVPAERTESLTKLAGDRTQVEEFILKHARLARGSFQSLTSEGVT